MTQRIRPFERTEIPADALAELRGVFPRADRFLTEAPDAPPMPPILGLLSRHATVAGPWLAYNGALLEHGVLDERTRELVILATARRSGSTYLWNEHLSLAARAGLTEAEIDELDSGDTDAWPERDRALLGAVDELLSGYTLADGMWKALASEFDDRELLELLFVVGTYSCLAMVLNGVRLQS